MAETCVFDKQSLGPLHCGHVSVAPLLPKLRGHFAEFLNKSSPVRLRIFFSSTCVGLRYGCLTTFSSFSRRCGFMRFPSLVGPRHGSAFRLAYFTTSRLNRLDALFRLRARTIPPCHCIINSFGSTGISTCCPSPTPFGLGLGPDLPWADEPSPGNLRLSTAEFLAPLSLLMPAFSLLCSPPPLPLWLLPAYIAPLPIHSVYSQASVLCFSPVNLRRIITRPVSYYALF